mgnify:CR=1 FL=1
MPKKQKKGKGYWPCRNAGQPQVWGWFPGGGFLKKETKDSGRRVSEGIHRKVEKTPEALVQKDQEHP